MATLKQGFSWKAIRSSLLGEFVKTTLLLPISLKLLQAIISPCLSLLWVSISQATYLHPKNQNVGVSIIITKVQMYFWGVHGMCNSTLK